MLSKCFIFYPKTRPGMLINVTLKKCNLSPVQLALYNNGEISAATFWMSYFCIFFQKLEKL